MRRRDKTLKTIERCEECKSLLWYYFVYYENGDRMTSSNLCDCEFNDDTMERIPEWPWIRKKDFEMDPFDPFNVNW